MKKPIIIGLVTTALISGLVVGGVKMNKTNADVEAPIVTEVRHQGEVLDNHEARLTNVEGDVSELQTNTNTSPSSNRQSVPAVATPSSTQSLSAPAPAPDTPEPTSVTVVAFEEVPVEGSEDMDCKLTYSDGTSHQWHWKKVSYNQGTKITNTVNKCDSSVIGELK